MILYHGSNTTFLTIELSKCLPNKDFGRGFYLTPSKHDATERAKDKCQKEHWGVPQVLKFKWDETNQQNLSIKKFDKVDEEWATFILSNRKRKSKQHHYDIVIGPVADDGVILSLQLYENGYLSMSGLIEKLTYARPSIQYAFCTERSIEQLQLL
ncbi:MAG: DUF3990 domain-containing protein [Paludibacteraceae bacterium]|nr:DUF3990 domain-containing protein [Paludibacteraceae bacterium]